MLFLSIMPLLLGAVVVAGVLYVQFKLRSCMWERLAHAMPPPPSLEWSVWKLIGWAAVSDHPDSTYFGFRERVYSTTNCYICDDGLLFTQQFEYLHPFCKPFYLPFDGLEVKSNDWLTGWVSSYALNHQDAPGLFLVLDSKAVAWIASQSRRFESLVAIGKLNEPSAPGKTAAAGTLAH